MQVIKAFDLAYGRLRSPDLDKQEEFLTDFGMVRADRTKKLLDLEDTLVSLHLAVLVARPWKTSGSSSPDRQKRQTRARARWDNCVQ